MRSRYIVPFLVGIASLWCATTAFAQELPEGIFQMADGRYYQPSSGQIVTSLADLGITSSTLSAITSATSTQISEPASATTTDTVVQKSSPLLSAIERAQAYLREHIKTDPSPDNGKTFTTQPTKARITLALWNAQTDALRYVTAYKSGTTLTRISDDIQGIRVTRTNGINSRYSIAGGEIVVGIQYTIFSSQVNGKKTTYVGQDVVYTPYSDALHTPEMVAEGERWLGQTMQRVYDGLRADGVKSKAYPDKVLADAMDPTLPLSIMLIEHIDEHALAKDAQNEVEIFYATLAANKDDAYDYSKSSAGALGLVQFIPSTYNALAKWPDLKLAKDFETGMRDPQNAIRAETAYLDYLLAHLPSSARNEYPTDPDLVSEYVAAAYNGGVSRVTKAMVVWDMNLDMEQRVHVLTRSRLKLETMHYVLKLRTLRDALRERPTLLASATVREALE